MRFRPVLIVLSVFVVFTVFRNSYAASKRMDHGTILSVQKILKNPTYIISRFPQIHYYDLFVNLRIANQSYCAKYTTAVTNEIDDVTASTGREIETSVEGKKLVLQLQNRRQIKCHLIDERRCAGFTSAK